MLLNHYSGGWHVFCFSLLKYITGMLNAWLLIISNMDFNLMPTTSKPNRLNELLYARCPVPSPLSIAMQTGWLPDAMHHLAAIDVRATFEANNPTDEPRLADMNQPNIFRQGGSVPVIWGRAAGQDTRVIGLTWTDEYQALIALPQSGIQSAKDLKGRRIGIPQFNLEIDHTQVSAVRGFSVILESVGLSWNDVERVDLPDHAIPSVVRDGQVIATGTGRRGRYSYSSEIDALSNGLVDAVYVKDFRGAQACHLLGARVIADINRHPDPQVRINNCAPRPLIVNAWLLDNYPHLVDCLIQHVWQAGEWATRHPSETLNLLSREVGWAESWISYAYGGAVHKNLQLDLHPGNIAALDTMKKFLLEYGYIKNDFSIDSWIERGPLEHFLRNNKRKTGTVSFIRPAWNNLNTTFLH